MAVVSVSAQNTRLDDAESTTNWGGIGGGTGEALETDFFYQGSNCIARKGAAGARGFYMSDDVDSDLSGAGTYNTVMFKVICTTPGLLDTKATPGFFISIGSASTPASQSSDYYSYYVRGSDDYPVDESWQIIPIDPNVVAYRDATTGTPGLTVVDYYALEYDQTGVSKSPNQGVDAVDIGAGLTLVGGDSTDPDGVWSDFSDFDFGTGSNRFGYVRERDGIFFCFGKLIIGSGTATVFNDTGQTVVFSDGLFAAGFSGVEVDLSNATNDVDFTNTLLKGIGTTTDEDTRPIFTVTGTSGAFDALTTTWDNFEAITFTSAATATSCTFSACDSLALAGGTLDSCTIFGASTADSVAFITDSTLANISDCDFTFSDGHAIEITAAGTYSFAGNILTGYGGTPGSNLTPSSGSTDAAIYNNSGGLVTINISGGGSTPSIRNAASSTTIVNNTVDLDIHVEDASGTAVENAQVYVQKATPTIFTSGAGNTAGDTDLVVTQTIDSDIPGTGVCSVLDLSLNLTLPYRYASHDGANTFTFPTEVTFNCTGGGTSTSLQDTVNDFTSINIEEGDTIRNTTDGSFAVVDEIVDADNITTSPLSGGSDNTWTSGDTYSVHKLATTLVSGTDTVDVPLVNLQTDASGDVTKSYSYASDTSVIIRVRNNNGATKYIPFNTSGNIASSGLTVTVVLTEDTEAT